MAGWMWIILLLAIPNAHAHVGAGPHTEFYIPDFEETGEVFAADVTIGIENATLNSFELINGQTLMIGGTRTSEYALIMYSNKRKILLEMPISIQFNFHGENVDEDGNLVGYDIYREKLDMYFRIPAIPNATLIEFVKGDKILLSIDLTKYCNSKVSCGNWKNEITCPNQCGPAAIEGTSCENAICEASETFATCPQDCKSGETDNFCDDTKDSVCDPDCTQDPDCRVIEEKRPGMQPLFLGIFGIIVVAIGILVMFLNKRQPPQTRQTTKYPPGYVPSQYRIPPRR